MVNWCHNLTTSISNDSKWKASIPMLSTFSIEINNIILKTTKDANEDQNLLTTPNQSVVRTLCSPLYSSVDNIFEVEDNSIIASRSNSDTVEDN